MKFLKPNNLTELFSSLPEISGKKYFLAGGTDINVQIKNGLIPEGTIIYINHLPELNGIRQDENEIFIGALTTYRELLNSNIIKKHLPFLIHSLKNFASPLLTTMSTLGGNIANGSPTNDVSPPLLVLEAELELISQNDSRRIPFQDFYLGYKKFALKENELIKGIWIKQNAAKGYQTFYKKVGSRKTLTIAKVSVAGLKRIDHGQITKIKIAVGSLNEYPRRLFQLENFLIGKDLDTLLEYDISEILKKEITPISDLRSEKEYRFQVCLNLITKFLSLNFVG